MNKKFIRNPSLVKKQLLNIKIDRNNLGSQDLEKTEETKHETRQSISYSDKKSSINLSNASCSLKDTLPQI